MPDFIFSSKQRQENLLSSALESIYVGYKNSIMEIHCEYGSLAFVKNHYNGFNIYQDISSICIVIGGPVLNFRKNDFIASKNNNEGTKSIFNRWIINNEMVWDEDLSGPFVAFYLSKKTGEVKLVTDMMSFIPVYSFKDELLIGTHIDSLSMVEICDFDEVSIAEFILNEVVTFPYTIWLKYSQLYPGTIYNWNCWKNKIECKSEKYWLPRESDKFHDNLEFLADNLRFGLRDYVEKVSIYAQKVASFVSGGEDSRCVLSLIPRKKDAIIFVDSENRESSIARKVCDKLDAKLIFHEREKNYYLNILEKASSLIGFGYDYAHVHTVGFVESCNMMTYDAIFGGFLADTLLKGHHIKTKDQLAVFRLFPIQKKIDKDYTYSINNSNIFGNGIIEKIKSRKAIHLSWIREMRCNSYNEWVNIYPITMHNDIPNILGNRRLFRSYEPFTCNTVVKIASLASQNIKLDRKLFQTAMKPILNETKWIRHANGSYPFLPWYYNVLFMNQITFANRINKLFKKKRSNEGSWINWEDLIYSDKALLLERKYLPAINRILSHVFSVDLSNGYLRNKLFNVRQKRTMLQLGYHLQKSEGFTK